MKTTINLDDQLVAEAKKLAVLERTSLTRLIEEGLALRLRPEPAYRVGLMPLPTITSEEQ